MSTTQDLATTGVTITLDDGRQVTARRATAADTSGRVSRGERLGPRAGGTGAAPVSAWA